MAGRNKLAAIACVRELAARLVYSAPDAEQIWRGPLLGLYTLDGRTPRPCSMDEWREILPAIERRRVGKTEIGVFTVFTTFLGIDHNFNFDGTGEPVLFETMVEYQGKRGASLNEDARYLNLQKRYGTWEQAEDGHARVVLFVRNNYDTFCSQREIDDDPHEEN
jgi:hypothetical protein